MRHNDKLTRRQMVRLPASISVCVVASLLMSCEEADNDVELSILEWRGYQQIQYHP